MWHVWPGKPERDPVTLRRLEYPSLWLESITPSQALRPYREYVYSELMIRFNTVQDGQAIGTTRANGNEVRRYAYSVVSTRDVFTLTAWHVAVPKETMPWSAKICRAHEHSWVPVKTHSMWSRVDDKSTSDRTKRYFSKGDCKG